MRAMYKRILIVLLCVFFSLQCASVNAANTDEAASRAQAKLQGMLRELAAERDRLKQEVSTLTGENQQLKSDLALQKQSAETAGRLNAELVVVKSSQQRLSDQYDQTRNRLQDISEKYKSLQHEQQRLSGDLVQSQQSHSAVSDELHQCMEKNLGLLKTSRELIDNMDQRSLFDNLLAQEPLFGLNAVELETQMQSYQDQLDAHRYKPSQVNRSQPANPNETAGAEVDN
ncbi:MAG: hypothetical protein RL563_2018 [Pseudomonadota bacterium]